MKMTEEGLALIRRFEGFRGEAYRCPAGIWTIGYGHTGRAGPPPVTPGLRMTEEAARRVLAADVERFAAEVRAGLTRELSDAQFSALVSFAYNVGGGGFRASSVLKAVNAGDFAAVPRRLQMWVKAGGKTLPGLVKRRAAEAELFMTQPAREGDDLPRTPDIPAGKPLRRSTTVLSALVAIVSAILTGLLNGEGGHGAWTSLLTAFPAVAAGGWIIWARLRTAKEEGI